MDDPFLVRGLQRVGNLLRHPKRLICGHRTTFNAVRQRLAVDELEHQKTRPIRFLEVMDRRNVGVIQRGQHFGFPLEPGQTIGVGGEGLGENLDRDVALQPGVARSVDSPIPPAPMAEWISYGPRRTPADGHRRQRV